MESPKYKRLSLNDEHCHLTSYIIQNQSISAESSESSAALDSAKTASKKKRLYLIEHYYNNNHYHATTTIILNSIQLTFNFSCHSIVQLHLFFYSLSLFKPLKYTSIIICNYLKKIFAHLTAARKNPQFVR